jgi:hypothetical protein
MPAGVTDDRFRVQSGLDNLSVAGRGLAVDAAT